MAGYKMLPQRKQSVPLLLIIGNLLLFFVVVGVTFSGMHPWAPNINRFVGVALVLSYLLCHFVYRLKLPPEIILFGGFVVWSVVTGFAVAADADILARNARLVIQLWALVFASAGLASANKSPTVQMVTLLIAAIALAILNWTGGFYAAGFTSDIGTRGLTPWNPSALAYGLLAGVFALAYFWRFRGSWTFRVLRLAIPPLALFLAFSLLSTGSRKAFVVLLLFGVLYLWFCYKREVLRNLGAVITVAIVAAGGWFMVDYVLHGETVMGLRFQAAEEEGGLGERRMELYTRGFELFLENPLTGVGLGNVASQTGTGSYSHSEYMEILAATGVVGAAIYFPIYVLLWRRLRRIEKLVTNTDVRYRIGVCKASMIAILALGVGTAIFRDPNLWFVLSAIIGYSYGVERSLGQVAVAIPRRARGLSPQAS